MKDWMADQEEQMDGQFEPEPSDHITVQDLERYAEAAHDAFEAVATPPGRRVPWNENPEYYRRAVRNVIAEVVPMVIDDERRRVQRRERRERG